MNVEQIIEALDTLSLPELRRVRDKVEAWIIQIEAWQDPDYQSGQEPQLQEKSYRQEYVTCGKASCKTCRDGQGHGPYWYAYWSEQGRTRKQYIGKKLPPATSSGRRELERASEG